MAPSSFFSKKKKKQYKRARKGKLSVNKKKKKKEKKLVGKKIENDKCKISVIDVWMGNKEQVYKKRKHKTSISNILYHVN